MHLPISENTSLKTYNTFGFDVKARYAIEITQTNQLKALLNTHYWTDNKRLIIGGGSNILLQHNFDGLVVINRIKGISQESEDAKQVIVKAGGGENWHEFVLYCLSNKLGGIENLSLIPGTVGAAPMQNIGAYGVEIKDVFHSLEAFNLQTKAIETFNANDCQFGYRESVFKNKYKDQYLILSVQFMLTKAPFHQLSLDYGIIKTTLQERQVDLPNIKTVSEAVVAIRQSKLPDPAEIGNSGSFFKNPIITTQQFEKLKERYPAMPGYVISADEIKVAAGWLIEQAGWKGHEENGVGVHKKQALVLVNKGTGNGIAVAQLAKKIQDSVKDKYDILLNPEVNFI